MTASVSVGMRRDAAVTAASQRPHASTVAGAHTHTHTHTRQPPTREYVSSLTRKRTATGRKTRSGLHRRRRDASPASGCVRQHGGGGECMRGHSQMASKGHGPFSFCSTTPTSRPRNVVRFTACTSTAMRAPGDQQLYRFKGELVWGELPPHPHALPSNPACRWPRMFCVTGMPVRVTPLLSRRVVATQKCHCDRVASPAR
jgi:hypothetical protein